MPVLDVRIVLDTDATIIEPHGDIDIENQRAFADLAVPLALSAPRYILDLSGVGFIDSTGIGVVARLRNELRKRHLPLHVVPSSRVRSALKLAALSDVLRLHGSVGAARHAPNDGSA